MTRDVNQSGIPELKWKKGVEVFICVDLRSRHLSPRFFNPFSRNVPPPPRNCFWKTMRQTSQNETIFCTIFGILKKGKSSHHRGRQVLFKESPVRENISLTNYSQTDLHCFRRRKKGLKRGVLDQLLFLGLWVY